MTTLQLRRLKKLNALGLNDQQIAEEIGASGSQVYYWRHYKLRLPCYGRTRRRPYSDYTIYDGKGMSGRLARHRSAQKRSGVRCTVFMRWQAGQKSAGMAA